LEVPLQAKVFGNFPILKVAVLSIGFPRLSASLNFFNPEILALELSLQKEVTTTFKAKGFRSRFEGGLLKRDRTRFFGPSVSPIWKEGRQPFNCPKFLKGEI